MIEIYVIFKKTCLKGIEISPKSEQEQKNNLVARKYFSAELFSRMKIAKLCERPLEDLFSPRKDLASSPQRSRYISENRCKSRQAPRKLKEAQPES